MVWYLNTILKMPNVTNIILRVLLRHMKNQKSVNKHKYVNYETSSGGDRPLPYNSPDEALKSLGLTLNFFESWLKSFNTNYEK